MLVFGTSTKGDLGVGLGYSISRTHVGLRRAINEDNCLVRPDIGLFVVADGMGGHDAGEIASAKIVEALEQVGSTDRDEVLREAVAALHAVNQDLCQLAASGDRPRTIGSTVVGLLLEESRFRCFWAGDSRAYRLRNGNLQQITRDHSLVQGLLDAGMLEPEKARDHPNENVITRAVGVAEELRLDIVEGDVVVGDLFLLATDGVTHVVPDEELEAALNASQPLVEVADGLVWTVLRRGAPDNLTLILVPAT